MYLLLFGYKTQQLICFYLLVHIVEKKSTKFIILLIHKEMSDSQSQELVHCTIFFFKC